MAVISWVRDALDKNGSPYAELHYLGAYAAKARAKLRPEGLCHLVQTVVLIADGRPVHAVLPESRRLDLKKFKEVLGVSEIHFAGEAEMLRLFPDCEVGAEPPLRHESGMGLWMDESLWTHGDILFSGGTHEDGIQMAFEDWYRIARPNVASFSQAPVGQTAPGG